MDRDPESFVEFQKKMKTMVENAVTDYGKRNPVSKDLAIKKILELRYAGKAKTVAKLLDEFNWATRGENKSS